VRAAPVGAPRGDVTRNHNFQSRVFAPAAAFIGMPGLTPHDLRHTAASLALQGGANIKAVQRMLGQAFAAMTLTSARVCSTTTSTRSRTAWTLSRVRLVRTIANAVDSRPVPPVDFGGEHAFDLRKHLVGRVGLEPTTQGL